MKLSDYVAKFLAEISDYAFVGQGSCVIHILDSIDKRDDIRSISSQNEQGASLAADAYSRASGKIGVSIATSGPGLLNLLQGVGCSFFDSIPHIIISGAVPTNQSRKSKNLRQLGFQEMEVVDIVNPLTKYAVLLKDPNKIKYELEKMLYVAVSGRPGPVLMDLPDDLQRCEIDELTLEGFIEPKKKKLDISDKITQTIELLECAKRPLIIVGNGVKLADAKKLLSKFIDRTGIPFLLTWAAFDLYGYEEENRVGTFGVAATRYGNLTVQNSDLLICLGTRLSYQMTGTNRKSFGPKAKKIIVEIDEDELFKENGVKPDLAILSCVKEFLHQISLQEINTNQKDIMVWKDWIKHTRSMFPICQKRYWSEEKYVNPYVFFDVLSDYLGETDVIIPDSSANLIWLYQALKPKEGQNIFTALNHSPMGYSIAASVGAKLGSIEKNVIAVIGDGSVSMNVQELETIAYNKLPVKIFIINNQGYGLIKGTQEVYLDKNYVGVDKFSGLGIPDFQKIANSYNIKYLSLDNHNDIGRMLKSILNMNEPIICDVKIDPDQRVIPKLDAGKPIHDMTPYISGSELKDLMI